MTHLVRQQAGLLWCTVLFVAGLLGMTAINALPGGVDLPRAVTGLHDPSPTDTNATQTAILAGGCFWGMESVFEHVRGVEDVVSGYTGGRAETATYSYVSEGETGHAEAIRIVFNPALISYTDLLQIFFSVAHDPTQLDRQGPDIGRHYRSAIFAVSPEQARVANAYIDQLDASGVFHRSIATTVIPALPFHVAETLHQNYAARFPDNLYVRMYDAPLVEALESRLPKRYRPRSVRLTSNR